MTFDIEFQDVSFQYEGARSPALQHVNLAVRPGEIVLLTGPAGSGKTTLCSCTNGLVPHYHEGSLTGQILVRGYDTKRARIGGLSSLVGLVVFYPDPEYGGFLALLGALEAGVIPESILTTVVTTIIMAALPERYRRPLW